MKATGNPRATWLSEDPTIWYKIDAVLWIHVGYLRRTQGMMMSTAAFVGREQPHKPRQSVRATDAPDDGAPGPGSYLQPFHTSSLGPQPAAGSVFARSLAIVSLGCDGPPPCFRLPAQAKSICSANILY
jgi:hypothetical protein